MTMEITERWKNAEGDEIGLDMTEKDISISINGKPTTLLRSDFYIMVEKVLRYDKAAAAYEEV